MADALCGPSNPLQNFQKHASVDRTLQRDQLVSRQSPLQGFRTPNPNAGILDAEFEAFVAGEPVAGPFHPQHEWQNHPPSFLQPDALQQKAPDWALDFQNLHVHESQEAPLPSARFREEAPLQRSSPGPWQQEFLQRERPQNVQHQQSRLGHANLDYPLHTYHSASYSHGYRAPASEQHVESHEKASFDEEAFEKAFNLASQELQEDKVDQPPPSEAYDVPDQRINYRIGSDRIFDDSLKRQEENSEVREADELARTAGQLLENVKHDQSTKFQESSFLSLMRQLRDKEVKVDGDNIVNVEQPLHPGGPGYPKGIEGLPADEEVKRPEPMTSRIRASSVPRQRPNGSLVSTEPAKPSPWSNDRSGRPESFSFDNFLT